MTDMKYKLLVFDWDGTLMNSVPHIVDCIRVASEAVGTQFPGEEPSRRIIGLGMHEALETLFGVQDANFVNAFRQAYSQHFFSRMPIGEDFFPGVLSTLQLLRSQGTPLAIATGKSWHGMQRALQALQMEHWFVSVKCADRSASKPDPLMLTELQQEHSLAGHEMLMVGDTSFDLEMAARAGVAGLGVSYGAHPPEELRRLATVGVVDDFKDILNYIS